MVDLYRDVAQFNKEVIGLPVPDDKIKTINQDRHRWFNGVVNEEMAEFSLAISQNDHNGQIDAIIDLTYFALGRLVEMGVTPEMFDHCWKQVQEANMKKVKGNKGRGSNEDAIKPEGWKPPDFGGKPSSIPSGT